MSVDDPNKAAWGEDAVGAWLAAADDAIVSAELQLIFDDVARAVEQRRPACWTSGRCCHFEQAGHRLYVTGLEAAWAVKGMQSSGLHSTPALARALQVGGCPFQVDRLCQAHRVRPLGCRVYFCDKSAELWQQELHEDLLRKLRSLHDRHRLPYEYGEWRGMLARFISR